MHIIEQFLCSKSGAPDGGEDRLILGPAAVGVVDGATDKSGKNWGTATVPATGAAFLAEITRDVFSNVRVKKVDPLGIVGTINNLIQKLAKSKNIDLTDSASRPQAGFAVYLPHRKSIVHLGDCWLGFVASDGSLTATRQEFRLEEILIQRRASTINDLLRQNLDPFSDGKDQGREAITTILGRAHELCNAKTSDTTPWLDGFTKGDFAYQMLDGISLVSPLETVVPPHTKEIILASDGFPVLCSTLAESLEKLRELLVEDPHCFKSNPGTKGLSAAQASNPNASYDDRSYVRIKL